MIQKGNRRKKHIQHSKPLIICLTECDIGTELIVMGVNAGYGAKRRLAHLEIVPGVKIIKKKSASISFIFLFCNHLIFLFGLF